MMMDACHKILFYLNPEINIDGGIVNEPLEVSLRERAP